MINLASVFQLDSEMKRGSLIVNPVEPVDEFRLLAGEIAIGAPLKFVRHIGSRANDLLDTGVPPLYLISERFRRVLADHGFTGWNVYPVEVFSKDKQPLEGFHGLSVSGRCGPIDDSRSEIINQPPVIPGRVSEVKVWRGLFFNPQTWDGSDLFLPERTGYVFATTRVKDVLQGAHLSNVRFQPITTIERLILR